MVMLFVYYTLIITTGYTNWAIITKTLLFLNQERAPYVTKEDGYSCYVHYYIIEI